VSDDLARVPQVTTLAKPDGRPLLDARFEVQRNAEVRATFEKYKGRKDAEAPAQLADEISGQLSERLSCSPESLQEVCRYLADEYLQVGDAVLIISRQTGKAIARITDKDMWQPDAVPRFGGDMVLPAARIRPELQGFLIRWEFEREREEKLVDELALNFPQVPSITRDEDRRLLPTTRRGREVIVQDLKDALPTLLHDALGGSLGRFIRLLDGVREEGREPVVRPEALTSFRGFKAYARMTMPLMDHKARNLLFDVLSSHRATIATQWGREIALTIGKLAHANTTPAIVSLLDFRYSGGLWLTTPTEAMALRKQHVAHEFCIPIEDCPTILVRDLAFPIGRLHCGQTQIASREIHDRWEVVATIDYDLDINLPRLHAVQLTDMPDIEYRAEVV
jgi:hypothetical protein